MTHSPAVTAAAASADFKLAAAVPRWVFFAVFAISGFSGLIYESIWSHYLKLFLGHAAYAQSLVLIIFMGGLAVGSWLAAKHSDRWRTPILVYAVIEGVIGVMALVFHGLFVEVADAFYFSILPSVGSPALGSALKWTAAAALIAPQSILLGMTFPLMSTGILRRYPDHPGGSLAMLYFTNSIGAAIGVLVSGFWLVGAVGLPGATMTAGLLNVALALLVWMLVKLDPQPVTQPILPSAERAATSDNVVGLFLFAAAVTGASSFMYEIGWIRMLSLVLGATTHSFELMLSAFITGLAFGGLWIKKRIDRIQDPMRFSGWVQILMGALAVLTLPLYVETFDWMAALLGALQRNDAGFDLFTVSSHAIALFVMVPTTFLAGMTLPLFTYVLLRGGHGERVVGRVYAANTLGAIVGVLFAIHVGMPLLGLENLIVLGALLDVLLGVVLLHRAASKRPAFSVAPGALVGAAVIVLVAVFVDLDPRRLGSGVYRYRNAELDERTRVLFYEDGKTASISLTVADSRVTIATNGKPDASIELDPAKPAALDEITMTMAGALPLAYNPGARRAANIGLGSGLTSNTLLADARLEHVDTIEIETAMVRAARGFGERVERTFNDPRSSIHIEDAKTFFSEQNATYDVIVSEPSNPWVSGVAGLFSQEFYRSVSNYLTPDGVFVQWLQLYEFNDQLALSIFKSLSAHFADFAIYNTDNVNILIVATPQKELPTPAFETLFSGAMSDELARVGIRGPDDFLVRKAGSRASLESMLAQPGTPPNSDFFPYVDLNAGRARFKQEVAVLFFSLGVAPLPVLEMLGVSEVSPANVTPDHSFERTQKIADAYALHAAVTNAAAQRSPPRPLQDGTLAVLLGSLRDTCGGATPELWMETVHTLALSTLAFVDSATADSLLATAIPEECARTAASPRREWFTLYREVAARDAAGMAAAATALLDGSAAMSPAQREYALAAGMLGFAASGRAELAARLWAGHAAAPDAGVPLAPEVRLMLSMAVPTDATHSATR
jgi:predicted membrane-bound spermidine synthase